MIKRKTQKINKKGFTLIELMISVAMVAILSAAMLQIARFSDTHKNLTLATDEVRAAIRMAQSYSLSIPNVNDRHICGFGFRVMSGTTYGVFYTYASNSAFEANADICDTSLYKSWNCPTKGTIKTFNLSGKSGTSIGTVDSDVFFESPYGDPVSARSFTISGGGGSKTISVKSSGQIN